MAGTIVEEKEVTAKRREAWRWQRRRQLDAAVAALLVDVAVSLAFLAVLEEARRGQNEDGVNTCCCRVSTFLVPFMQPQSWGPKTTLEKVEKGGGNTYQPCQTWP
jgi:hypothetical protein